MLCQIFFPLLPDVCGALSRAAALAQDVEGKAFYSPALLDKLACQAKVSPFPGSDLV